MEQTIKIVPKDLLCLIPKFEGEQNLLNLFIKKAQYIRVYNGYGSSNPVQETYVFHAITSRLHGRAAALLSEREDIISWGTLINVLIQHFGDPRSEECIAIELEQMKLNSGESYIEFCHRIQHMRSTLFAKVNLISDEGVKAAKMIVYNNTALNVFLYNLPEDLIRIVRLKGCSNLESALSIVTEEVNFMTQFNAKLKQRQASAPNKLQHQLMPTTNSNPINNFRFGTPPAHLQNKPLMPNHNFKFGIPQQQPQGFRPQNPPTGFRFNQNPGPQGFRFGVPGPQPGFNNFGSPQQGQGYRPPFNSNFNRPTQPFGQPQQNFKFGIPNQNVTRPKPIDNTDVSMRTARPLRQNMLEASADNNENLFYNNELVETSPEQNCDQDVAYYDESFNYNLGMQDPQMYDTVTSDVYDYEQPSEAENFYVLASNHHPK